VKPIDSRNPVDLSPTLRPVPEVMDLPRLGSLHQFRLSFMRTLVRKLASERWNIQCTRFELDPQGYGTAIYSITAPNNVYSFVLFSNYLSDEDRNDRVIASQWDLTMTLVLGEVSEQQIEEFRANVPLQEAGRMNTSALVLSRANRSSRNFDYVVDTLARGHQPDIGKLTAVGYLYRTTAVYGSGKFGMADWARIKSQCPDFARPFAAEMFTCYMLRHFCVEQAEHIARARAPATAVTLQNDIRRYIGIGNATGLGMAPFLIKHPQLIAQWILVRETAIAQVLDRGEVSAEALARLQAMLDKAIQHTREIIIGDDWQAQRNKALVSALAIVQEWLRANEVLDDWRTLTDYVRQNHDLETQELLHSLLLELYPTLVDDLEEQMCVEETLDLRPEMSLKDFKACIETHYDWALAIDFQEPDSQALFWYRSEEKMEPRIGQRFSEPGADKEIPITIARLVRQCYDRLCDELNNSPNSDVAHFLLSQPDLRGIIRRIQSMALHHYGEIRANLADKDTLPIQLLRCKLSFFGVGKFDPKSKLWVRNTMFQGAPLLSDLTMDQFRDDWYFPIAPAPQ
jgi:hypothetical protein